MKAPQHPVEDRSRPLLQRIVPRLGIDVTGGAGTANACLSAGKSAVTFLASRPHASAGDRRWLASVVYRPLGCLRDGCPTETRVTAFSIDPGLLSADLDALARDREAVEAGKFPGKLPFGVRAAVAASASCVVGCW